MGELITQMNIKNFKLEENVDDYDVELLKPELTFNPVNQIFN